MAGTRWRSASSASCSARLEKKISEFITSPAARCRARVAKAASKSATEAAGMNMNFKAQRAGGRPHCGNDVIPTRIDKKAEARRRGDQLVQQFKSLRCELRAQAGHTGEVAAGSV